MGGGGGRWSGRGGGWNEIGRARRPPHPGPLPGGERERRDKRMKRALIVVAAWFLIGTFPALAGAQAIEGELALITPVSKFIHDAALKAFADHAKEKWGVT